VEHDLFGKTGSRFSGSCSSRRELAARQQSHEQNNDAEPAIELVAGATNIALTPGPLAHARSAELPAFGVFRIH
jgi:hypothetical protein